MRRLRILCTAFLLVLCFRPASVFALSLTGEGKLISTPADAQNFVQILLGDTPEKLDGAWKLTGDMADAIAAGGGFAGLAAGLAPLGTIQKIDPAYPETRQGYDCYRVPCRFSGMNVDLVLVLEKGMLAGLVTDQFTGTSEEMTEAVTKDFITEALSLPVPSLGGELPGTLTLPTGDGPFPALVLVHGSGPCDRDETVMSVKPFRDIAESLASYGIAVYRYDKRTYVYGSEMASDTQVTLEEETIEDAAAAVQLLTQRDNIDPDRIFVLGHSLGATAIPAINRELKKEPHQARGYILLAPAARPLDELMRDQYEFLDSLEPETDEESLTRKEQIFEELDRLDDIASLSDEEMIAGAYVPYWRWLSEYDVTKAAKEITAPCLLLQGEEDYQVTMNDFELFRQAVGDRENWQFISYPGLVHTFTHGKKEDGPSAYMRSENVDGQVISDIAAFVLES